MKYTQGRNIDIKAMPVEKVNNLAIAWILAHKIGQWNMLRLHWKPSGRADRLGRLGWSQCITG